MKRKRIVLALAAVGLGGLLWIWQRDKPAPGTEQDPAVTVLKEPPSGGWNLETNRQGAIFHREGTNLWWLSGPLPQEDVPGLVNVPTRAERAARAESNRLASATLRSGFELLNSQEIVFYGLAVDEKTNALAGPTGAGNFRVMPQAACPRAAGSHPLVPGC